MWTWYMYFIIVNIDLLSHDEDIHISMGTVQPYHSHGNVHLLGHGKGSIHPFPRILLVHGRILGMYLLTYFVRL